MNKEIILVTAFFDINRKDFETYPRTNEKYFEYFSFWARMKNRLVVYCAENDYKTIYDIRRSFGLEEKTEIIIIDNIFEIEPNLYENMERISHSEDFNDFRYFNKSPENKATYSYVVLMKSWFVYDVSKRYKDVNIAWIDFGFNHGGEFYTDKNDFNYTWDYDFPDKITVFCLENPDEISSIDSLQFQIVSIMGAPVIIPDSLAKKNWEFQKNAMWSLISLDCIDDDQQMLLMSYKLHKELFNIVYCDWFEPLAVCSNGKVFSTIHDSIQTNKLNKPVKKKLTIKKQIKKQIKKLKKNPFENNRKQREQLLTDDQLFLIRMKEKTKKYYGNDI